MLATRTTLYQIETHLSRLAYLPKYFNLLIVMSVFSLLANSNSDPRGFRHFDENQEIKFSLFIYLILFFLAAKNKKLPYSKARQKP